MSGPKVIVLKGAQVWKELKPILLTPTGKDDLFEKGKGIDFIGKYINDIMRLVPYLHCDQTRMFVFSLALLGDPKAGPEWDVGQNESDVDLIFDSFFHDCFTNKERVTAMLHYMAVAIKGLPPLVLYAVEKLIKAAGMDMATEKERFIYATGCENVAFAMDSKGPAEPSPYAVAIAKKYFTADKDEWYTHLACYIDSLIYAGDVRFLNRPSCIPPENVLAKHFELNVEAPEPDAEQVYEVVRKLAMSFKVLNLLGEIR